MSSPLADQQARAGDRRERHRALQLWIIAAAGALECVGPAMVEDIFALAVRLQIAGHRAEQSALRILQPEMMALPAGAPHGAAGIFKRAQKSEGNERVVAVFCVAARRSGKAVPFLAGEGADAGGDADRIVRIRCLRRRLHRLDP